MSLILLLQDANDNPYHLHHLEGHEEAIRYLDVQGRVAVSGSYDHTVRVWDIVTGTCTLVLSGHTDKGAVQLSPNVASRRTLPLFQQSMLYALISRGNKSIQDQWTMQSAFGICKQGNAATFLHGTPLSSGYFRFRRRTLSPRAEMAHFAFGTLARENSITIC